MDLGTQFVRSIGILMQVVGYLLVVRALLSWFPNARGNQIVEIIYQITDPIILPLRRIIPPLGLIDISVMIAVLFLLLVGRYLTSV
jgi:YggT family protein